MLREYSARGQGPDLLREMRRMQEEMNRVLGGLRLAPRTEFPPVNVWVSADGAIVTAEIAGVSPEQIDATVHQDTVSLRGKREPEPLDDTATVLRQERIYGPFARTVVLPFRVDADKVTARCERGVLILELPRPAADKPRKIEFPRA